MRYFENFGLVPYTFDPDRINFFNVKDIFTRVKMLDSIINNIDVYYTYDMKDSDTVEMIAYKYYGDINKFWIILFTNQILDPQFELPLKPEAFNEYLINKYGSPTAAYNTLDHYEKKITVTQSASNGFYLQTNTTTEYSSDTYSMEGLTVPPSLHSAPIALPSPPDCSIGGVSVHTDIVLYAVSAYDAETESNESRRSIKLIKKDFVNQIESELRDLLSK